MTFLSVQFALFFVVTLLAYHCFPVPQRWRVLLVASLTYAATWGPTSLVVLLGCCAWVYGSARQLQRAETSRRGWLIVGLILPVAALLGFRVLPVLRTEQPAGLSFYALLLMGYLLDVYRQRLKAERNPMQFALFGAFFLPLVSGPIGRTADLRPQFRLPRLPAPDYLAGGLRLILWGAFKKLVVADRLGIYVDAVYVHPTAAHPLQIVLATYFFAFQVYCDFSAFSDIVVGMARLLGIDLIQNFRRPFLAESIQEFWRRWHISLTAWLREYLYAPLTRWRLKHSRDISRLRLLDYPLVLIFVLSGLWHGFTWNFLLWGVFHGAALLCSHWIQAWRLRHVHDSKGFPKALAVLLTFHLSLVGWVLFRSPSLEHTASLLVTLTDWTGSTRSSGVMALAEVLLAVGGILAVLGVEIWAERLGARDIDEASQQLPRRLRWAAYYLTAAAILFFGVFAESSFIYFRF